MISSFKKISNSFLFRIIIFLIILSFVLWGINDVFKESKKDYVIAIDNKYFVNNKDYLRAKANYIHSIQASFGTHLNPEQIQKLNLDPIISNYLIDSKLFELMKDDFKLEISDDIVISHIRDDETFFDQTKKFNKDFFSKILESNVLSENQLASFIKNDKAKEFITNTIIADNTYPQQLKEIFSQFFNEKRSITLAYISPNNLKINNPDEKTLENLYQEKKELFTVPESRKISYLEISPQTVKTNVKISDSEIKEEYKNYIAENYTLEKRDIYNLVFKDKEKAEEALKLLKAGHDFIKTAEKYSTKSPDKLLMRGITKSDLPAELQNDAFGLNKDYFSKIITTNSGFHIIKVADIHQVSHPKYEIVREDLYKNLVKKKSEELVYEYAKDIEDSIASMSKDINDLAKEFNLNIKTLPSLTYDNFTEKNENTPFIKLANTKNIIFSKNLKDLELIEDQDSSRYFLVSIEEITAKRNQTLEEIKEELIKLWTEKEIEVQIVHLLNKLKQDIKNNTLSNLAIDNKLYITDKMLYRDISRNNKDILSLPDELIQNMLTVENNNLTNAYKINDKYVFAQVNTIAYEKSNIPSYEEKISQMLQEQSQKTYLEDLILYLRNNHDIRVNITNKM